MFFWQKVFLTFTKNLNIYEALNKKENINISIFSFFHLFL